MAAGDLAGLQSADRRRLDQAIRDAEQASRFEFSLFWGDAQGDPHDFATSLHNSLVVPSRSVLILLDPERRVLEIVTGQQVRSRLEDQRVREVAQEMVDRFADGKLVDGLVWGVGALAARVSAAAPH